MASPSCSVSISSSSERASSPPLGKRKRDEDSDDSTHVPTLSHAERRKQKKKEKQEANDATESASKKRKLKDGTPAAVTGKRQNSVWVGNLSFKTTPENLQAFFEGVGEITRIHMPTKVANGPGMKSENRGFAYVDFATAEAKAAAIGRSEKPLIGRKLLIKDGNDFTGRPALQGADGVVAEGSDPSKSGTGHSKTAQKILRAQKQPPAPTLFLGNLGFETTEKSIREFFEAHRVVKKEKPKGDHDTDEEEKPKQKDVWLRKVRMGTFEDSGLCKGFAFVDFMTTEYATAALINPKNHQLDGRKLVIEYASAEAVRRGGGPKNEEGSARPAKRVKSFNREGRDDRRQRPQSSSRFNDKADYTKDVSENQIETPEDKWPAKRNTEGEGAGAGERTHSRGVGRGAGGREKGPRVRPKPGAALALAKRESAAILPSQGQKITF